MTEAMRGLTAPAVNGLKHLLEPLLLRRRLMPPEDPIKQTPNAASIPRQPTVQRCLARRGSRKEREGRRGCLELRSVVR
jgi:hypothetical protein